MNYYQQHHEDYLEGLKTFLRIPSISTLPEHRGDIDRAAEFVAVSSSLLAPATPIAALALARS